MTGRPTALEAEQRIGVPCLSEEQYGDREQGAGRRLANHYRRLGYSHLICENSYGRALRSYLQAPALSPSKTPRGLHEMHATEPARCD
jgi:hypothetical protein